MSYSLGAVTDAILSHLAAQTSIKTLLGNPARVYERVPAGSQYPYIMLRELSAADFGTKDQTGLEIMVVLGIYTRDRSSTQHRAIESAVYNALHGQTFSITGHVLTDCRFRGATISTDADTAQQKTLLRFRLITQENI